MITALQWLSGILFTATIPFFLSERKQGIKVFNSNNIYFIIAFFMLFSSIILYIISLLLKGDRNKQEIELLREKSNQKDTEITELKTKISSLESFKDQVQLKQIPQSVNTNISTESPTVDADTTIKLT
ncbi:hypothetical protein [Latilactobacillus curvatus]|uniref:hypothetical protein n=1 Tax=Latilactobacillus curvatus TaxID=28038 RepID=UPI00280B95B4|nr:hypothetical protein [Latilactobacillus curvatus]